MLEKKIMVVCGGISTEREVSLRSGAAVYEAMRRSGCENVVLFDLQQDNMARILEERPDICFLALHGKGGEDGCIQGMLELAGIPYTGSGVTASAVCMDKILTKQVLEASGLPTAEFLVFRKDQKQDTRQIAKRIRDEIGIPAVLKSPCQGSSIGVLIVRSEEDLAAAVEEIYTYGDVLMAECFVDGTEVTLPIMGNHELTILPDIEITSERDFYDYTAKYTQGMCHHIMPARISDTDRQQIRALGQQAYEALGCKGLARIDYIIDEQKGPMIIEVNTLPGMTEMSLFPDSARFAGISFESLVMELLCLGMEAHKEKKERDGV